MPCSLAAVSRNTWYVGVELLGKKPTTRGGCSSSECSEDQESRWRKRSACLTVLSVWIESRLTSLRLGLG